MKTYYFLSDLHLRDMQDEKAQKLLRFFVSLQSQAPQNVIFLVGDIFDLWLGDHDYFSHKFSQLIDQIQQFIIAGGEVHYFEGNHDLHLKRFWQDEMGVIVHTDPEEFDFEGSRVRIEHGDQMDPADTGYHFLRWFLRTPVIAWIIIHLPGFVVANIGEWMSRTSRAYTNSLRDPGRIKTIIHQHALKRFEIKNFDVILSGHVHLKDEFIFEKEARTIRSFNLGCWDQTTSILMLSEKKWQWQLIE
jgi:UDP-2,3-diacylglucosamine hydrolase